MDTIFTALLEALVDDHEEDLGVDEQKGDLLDDL